MVFTAYRGSNSWVEPLPSIPWANKGISAISGPKIHWTFETLFTNLSAVYLPKQTNKAVSWFAPNLKNCYDFGPVIEWLIEILERDKKKCGWEQCASLVTPASLRRWMALSSSKHTVFFIHLCLCPSLTVTAVASLTYSKSNRTADVKSFFTQKLSPFLYKHQDHRSVGQSFWMLAFCFLKWKLL